MSSAQNRSNSLLPTPDNNSASSGSGSSSTATGSSDEQPILSFTEYRESPAPVSDDDSADELDLIDEEEDPGPPGALLTSRAQRCHPTAFAADFVRDVDEPRDLADSQTRPDAFHWLMAAKAEIKVMHSRDVWDLISAFAAISQ